MFRIEKNNQMSIKKCLKKNNIEKSHRNILTHYVIFKVSLTYNKNDAESKKIIDNGHGL